MERSELLELHYIAPMDNLTSIMQVGILSHNLAKEHRHTSVANLDVQGKRMVRRVPGGLLLHDYACLYFNARNAMMFSILGFPSVVPAEHLNVCVLSISTEVLDIPDAIISDGNAAAGLSRFRPSPDGLQYLDKETVFARYWTDPDPIEETRKRESMMAEVLVPNRIDADHLEQVYVCCTRSQQKAEGMWSDVPFIVNKYLFFNSGRYLHD